jgi:hypothetical protein
MQCRFRSSARGPEKDPNDIPLVVSPLMWSLAPHRLRSTDELLAESNDTLMELELLRRRCFRACAGSTGVRPEVRAKRLRMSVRDVTPLSLPDRRAPGAAEADTVGEGKAIDPGEDAMSGGGTVTAGWDTGVCGTLEAGLGASTTHIL